MARHRLLCALLALILPIVGAGSSRALTLQEAVAAATPGGGYDRYVVLETGQVYTGGLLIGPILSPVSYLLEGAEGEDVRIVGNGAILDLQGQQLCISYCNHRLDIDDCVVLNGTVRFRGMNNDPHHVMPTGSVRHVTFYGPHDYGIRLQGAGAGITLEDNLAVDALDTGYDYIYVNGISTSWLPTGTNFSFSAQDGFYGTPVVRRNWSFHTDFEINATPLAHFSRLCEYG